MGDDQYGLHHRFTKVSQAARFYLGVIDKMTKSTHFLSVKTTHSAEDFAKLYIQEVVRLHGVSVLIISDRVE